MTIDELKQELIETIASVRRYVESNQNINQELTAVIEDLNKRVEALERADK